MFTGLLLKESLKDESILEIIQITKTETWDVDNAADFQPKTWTAIYFEGDESQVAVITEKLSQALKPCWYANVSTENDEYVVFPNKVFTYTKGDKQKITEAVKYGQSLGIPNHQLDWFE
ncbi:MAG: hypothetical protein IIB44_09440 [Candidatus Marinimicrobia bacterium]|nr:hypothetical protein [Candidatus Neomarinimicrobiota bacterium]